MDSTYVNRSRFLQKKFRILFYISIFQIITNLLTNNKLISLTGIFALTVLIVDLVVEITYGVILLLVSKESERLKIAGICYIATPIAGIVGGILVTDAFIIGLINLVLLIVGFVALYQEMYGFSDALRVIDYAVSEKWREIWKKMLFWLGVFLVSMIVSFIMAWVGKIGMFVSIIMLLVACIMRLVCMKDSSNVCDRYIKNNE